VRAQDGQRSKGRHFRGSRASDTVAPLVACPSKRAPDNESCAKGSPLWFRMISAPRSNVHLRLVKKLSGQPPSGAIVPCAAPAALPKVMKHAPPPAAVSFQRPARSIGGGGGGGGGVGTALACGSGRSAGLPAHPGSAKKTTTRAAAIAARALHRPMSSHRPISVTSIISGRETPNCGRKRSPKTGLAADITPHLRQYS
jgi:hypothetical protein